MVLPQRHIDAALGGWQRWQDERQHTQAWAAAIISPRDWNCCTLTLAVLRAGVGRIHRLSAGIGTTLVITSHPPAAAAVAGRPRPVLPCSHLPPCADPCSLWDKNWDYYMDPDKNEKCGGSDAHPRTSTACYPSCCAEQVSKCALRCVMASWWNSNCEEECRTNRGCSDPKSFNCGPPAVGGLLGLGVYGRLVQSPLMVGASSRARRGRAESRPRTWLEPLVVASVSPRAVACTPAPLSSPAGRRALARPTSIPHMTLSGSRVPSCSTRSGSFSQWGPRRTNPVTNGPTTRPVGCGITGMDAWDALERAATSTSVATAIL